MQKHSPMSTKDWLLYKYLMLASNPGFSLTSKPKPFVSSYNQPCYVVSSCLNKLDLLFVFQDIKFGTWHISIMWMEQLYNPKGGRGEKILNKLSRITRLVTEN